MFLKNIRFTPAHVSSNRLGYTAMASIWTLLLLMGWVVLGVGWIIAIGLSQLEGPL